MILTAMKKAEPGEKPPKELVDVLRDEDLYYLENVILPRMRANNYDPKIID